KKGISGRAKLAAQILIAAAAVIYLFYSDLYDADLKLRVAFPLVDFYKHPMALWMPAYMVLAVIVIVGASNGVNMTDGLDGLSMLTALTKNEFTLGIVGGIFVGETLSVMVQVASFKLTGKRVFKMAPIHHHFELKGWAEPKVIVRFWIISFMLALVGLATLK